MVSDSTEAAETLGVEEAAKLLHLNVKRVQALARSKKLPAFRIGRRWLFHRHDIDRLFRRPKRTRSDEGLHLSARNRLRGRILEIHVEGLMAEIVLSLGDQELVAVITRSSVERLKLKVGDEAYALVKSTEVMIGKG